MTHTGRSLVHPPDCESLEKLLEVSGRRSGWLIYMLCGNLADPRVFWPGSVSWTFASKSTKNCVRKGEKTGILFYRGRKLSHCF